MHRASGQTSGARQHRWPARWSRVVEDEANYTIPEWDDAGRSDAANRHAAAADATTARQERLTPFFPGKGPWRGDDDRGELSGALPKRLTIYFGYHLHDAFLSSTELSSVGLPRLSF